MKSKGKVMVGMSGGVDSSVAAAILKKEGYEVVGVYMNLWADPTVFDLDEQKKFPQNKCCSIESLMAARQICQQLGIPFYSMNLEETFKENVVEFFLEGFRQGETPNPCVRCNKTIKFGAFFKKMEELGCDYLATGHYAMVRTGKDGVARIHRGKDMSKDQTYFLYNLSQDKLKKILFPLGDYDKPQVRELAKEFGLKLLEKKKESQGVCFYPEKTYFGFLERYLKEDKDYKPGTIQDEEGKVVGEHRGLPFYTIGQRKGLQIGGLKDPYFVKRVDSIKNALIVGSEKDLETDEILLRDLNFLSGEIPSPEEIFELKIRSHGKLGKGRVAEVNGQTARIELLTPENAVMKGQSLVLYRGTELVGGGIIR